MKRLSPEDLNRMRVLIARDRSIEVRPDDYSRTEREDHYRNYMITMGDIFETYQLGGE